MKRIIFLFSLLILVITVNAQHYRVYHRHYPRHRKVYIEHRVPYYEREVVYIKEKPKREQIVVNNLIVNDHKHNRCDDENEYISLEYENNTNNQINTTRNFDYEDMWSQTIWFKSGSYNKIRTDGKIALDNVYNFLSKYSDAKIVLYGYASRRYGTYNYNKNLAEKRVRTISNYLVNVYQLDWSRIDMRVIGTDSAEYDEDKWNQCVVIKCEH